MLRDQAWCGEERRRDAEHKGSDAVLREIFVARATVYAKRESMTRYGVVSRKCTRSGEMLVLQGRDQSFDKPDSVARLEVSCPSVRTAD